MEKPAWRPAASWLDCAVTPRESQWRSNFLYKKLQNKIFFKYQCTYYEINIYPKLVFEMILKKITFFLQMIPSLKINPSVCFTIYMRQNENSIGFNQTDLMTQKTVQRP